MSWMKWFGDDLMQDCTISKQCTALKLTAGTGMITVVMCQLSLMREKIGDYPDIESSRPRHAERTGSSDKSEQAGTKAG
jgi:hypothetical protein